MKKRIFYPIWKLEKIEAELAQMERQGWRLSRLLGMNGFEFTKSPPKETQYFLTYSAPRGPYMFDIENEIKSQAKANPVGEDMSSIRSVKAFRITQQIDLQSVKKERDRCLLKIMRYNMLCLLLLTVPWLSIFIMACICDENWFRMLLAGILSAVFLVGAVYYGVAWWMIKHKFRREEK